MTIKLAMLLLIFLPLHSAAASQAPVADRAASLGSLRQIAIRLTGGPVALGGAIT